MFTLNKSLYRSSFGLVLVCSLFFPLQAQHLSLFNINSENHPRVTSQFYAFDSTGKQVLNLTENTIQLTENNSSQEVVKVTNPEYKQPKAISLVLAADVSGSMLGPNMKIAKMGIRSIIKSIPLDYSECALTSFDDNNYINSDFTKDINRLKDATNTLIALGGTDYDVAFNNPLTGALELARGGEHKRILIFLTDGLGKGNESAIINKAQSLGITVYCITVNMAAPEVLKNIAEKTGGRFFENVNSPEQAKSIYQQILYEAQEIEPSQMEWISDKACLNTKTGFFTSPSVSLESYPYQLTIPLNKTTQLRANIRYIEAISPNSDTIITIEAINDDFIITSIESELFDLKLPHLPSTLKKGEKKAFLLSPKKNIGPIITDQVLFHNDMCHPLIVRVSQSEKINTPVKILRPNGGEVLYSGMDTIITWQGSTDVQTIDLELSKDNGHTWDTIFNHLTDNQQNWRIPQIESDQLLIRATKKEGNTQIKEDSTGKISDHTFKIRRASFSFSPDKTKLLCQDINSFQNKEITVHDLHTGKVLHTFDGDKTVHARFSKDGSKIYLTPRKGGQHVQAYDSYAYHLLEEYPVMKFPICYNLDNTHYLHRPKPLSKENSNEFLNQLIEIKTGKVISSFTAPNFKASSIMEDCAIGFTATINYNRCEIWEINKQNKLFHIDTRIAKLFYKKAYLSRDKKYLVLTGTASKSDLDPNFIEVYDVEKNKLIFAESTRGSYSTHIDLSTSNRLLRVNNRGNVVLQDLASGLIHHIYDKKYLDGKMSRDGKFIVLKSREVKAAKYTRGLYKIRIPKDSIDATDVSDETFSITRPKLQSIDIDFGNVITGESKDKVVTNFLNNPHKIEIPIQSIYFEGQNSKAFSLVSGNTPFVITPGENKDLEFRFAPSRSGDNKAQIVIVSAYDTIKQNITGIGVSPGYALAKDRINLGKIKVGQTKDYLISNILRNTGKHNMNVRFVKIIGPDKQQFSLDIEKDFTLKPGATKDVNLSFNPILRGRTSSRIFFEVENVIGYQVVEVFGEGIAPKEYKLIGKTINKLTGEPMAAKVNCTELDSDKEPWTINTTVAGDFQFKMNADRVYILKGEQKEFSTTIDTIDLRIHTASKIITNDLIIAPPKGSEPVEGRLVVYGKLLDEKSKKPLNGSLHYYDFLTKEKLGEVTTDSIDGTYRLVLDLGKSYRLISKVKEHFPSSKTINHEALKGLEVIKKDFLLANVMAGETVQLNHVLFVVGKSELLSKSYSQLDLLSQFLSDNESVKIELSGHTDNSGSSKLNQKLSENRVTTIKKYLIEKGVPKNRISGTGYGGRKPIASNKKEETRRLNRRVEFKVAKK